MMNNNIVFTQASFWYSIDHKHFVEAARAPRQRRVPDPTLCTWRLTYRAYLERPRSNTFQDSSFQGELLSPFWILENATQPAVTWMLTCLKFWISWETCCAKRASAWLRIQLAQSHWWFHRELPYSFPLFLQDFILLWTLPSVLPPMQSEVDCPLVSRMIARRVLGPFHIPRHCGIMKTQSNRIKLHPPKSGGKRDTEL